MSVETTRAVGDADLGAKDERCALVGHDVGKVERRHQIIPMIVGEFPYLARQFSVFNHQAHRGIPPRWLIVGRDSPRSELEGARNTKHRQARAVESVIPYILCVGLY